MKNFHVVAALCALLLSGCAAREGSWESWCASTEFLSQKLNANLLADEHKIDPYGKLSSDKVSSIYEKAQEKGFKLAVIARTDFTKREILPDGKENTEEVETWMKRVAADSTLKRNADTLALILDSGGTYKVYLYNAAGRLPVANGKFHLVTAKAKAPDDALDKILPALDRSFVQMGISFGLATISVAKFSLSYLATSVFVLFASVGWFKAFTWRTLKRPDQVRFIQGLRDVSALTFGKRAGDFVMRSFGAQ